MNRFGLVAVALAVPGSLVAGSGARAEDASKAPPGVDCTAKDAPYKNYKCLDPYLGDDVLTRLYRYYNLEIGHDAAPADPSAPPGRRAGGADAPQSTPPYPFTEWPYGGSTSLGVTRPSSADSPLMVSIANTHLGQWMNENHIQVYGWVNGGGNISSNTSKPMGNQPAAYDVNPNSVQLDQAVVYVERVPDTVQKDHIDWGFRFAPIYGENYRYTYAYGVAPYQFNGHNLFYGYDFPMVYGELYIPYVMDGLLLRLGRFISLPDIEAQLAPNNYMYTHSMTYSWDNYTNTGLQATVALNKNWFFQAGLTVGSEAMPWNAGVQVQNPAPNPVFPGSTMLKDPGAQPSITLGVRWQSDSGKDNIYVVSDAINAGTWGYNNLQWSGITWYHTINKEWHFAWETYTLFQRNVLNADSGSPGAAILGAGGFPWNSTYVPYNSPNGAFCSNPTALACDARAFASVMYLNWHFAQLDNLSFRFEYYDDMQGQRTDFASRYLEFGVGWQHWLSPQIEFRPEISYYNALDNMAFNSNLYTGLPPTRHYAIIGAADIIWHF
jgi:Putative beta-barrel porin-2, OmpL-like. bbp2